MGVGETTEMPRAAEKEGRQNDMAASHYDTGNPSCVMLCPLLVSVRIIPPQFYLAKALHGNPSRAFYYHV